MAKVVNHSAVGWQVAGGFLGMLLCYSPTIWAAKLKLEPTLSFKTAYVDNVNSAVASQAEHDWIVQLNPGLSARADGARVQLSANYTMQNLIYLRHHNQNRVQHQLSTTGRAELSPDLLFVDAYANVSQQNGSTLLTGFRDESGFNNNLTDVTTLGVSPYLRMRHEDHWLSEVRYTHNRMSSDAVNLSDSQMDSVLLSLTQNVPGKRASWGASYRYAHTNNSGAAVDYDQYSVMANGRYRITPKFGMLASLGYEKYGYQSIADDPEGALANIGFFWVPNARGLVDLSIGKRFYGTSYALSGNYRMAYGNLSASYNEDVTTSQSQYFLPLTLVGNNGASPVRLTENTNVFSNRIFLDKTFQVAVSLKRSQTSVRLSANHTRREAQNEQRLDSGLFGSVSSAITDHFSQLGMGVAWGWQFAPRMESNVAWRYRKDDYDAVNTDLTHWSFQWGVSRQFQRDLKGSLEYTHTQSDGNQQITSYRNNNISANIQLTF